MVKPNALIRMVEHIWPLLPIRKFLTLSDLSSATRLECGNPSMVPEMQYRDATQKTVRPDGFTAWRFWTRPETQPLERKS